MMVLQFIDLKERNKKTIIEPQHISKRHRVPELYDFVQDAWAKQLEFSKEAVKELFVLMETYSHVQEVLNLYIMFKCSVFQFIDIQCLMTLETARYLRSLCLNY